MRRFWSPRLLMQPPIIATNVGAHQRSTSHSLTQRSLSLPLTRSSAICCAVFTSWDLNPVPVSTFVIDENMRPGTLNS
jgi:hypothetical protein